jgi:hypothetical protein
LSQDAQVKEQILEVMGTMSRMVEESRRIEAARLLPDLIQLMTHSAELEMQQWPPCIQCRGFAEIPHATESQRKVSCPSEPKRCGGNQYGRMSPKQFIAYVETMTTGIDLPDNEQALVDSRLREWAARMKDNNEKAAGKLSKKRAGENSVEDKTEV